MADVKKMDVFLRTLEGLTARGVQRLDAIAEDKIEELQTIVEFAKNKTAKSEHVAMLSSVTKKPRTARRELLSLGIIEADKENLENGVLTRRARMSRAAEATPLKAMDVMEVSKPSERKRKAAALDSQAEVSISVDDVANTSIMSEISVCSVESQADNPPQQRNTRRTRRTKAEVSSSTEVVSSIAASRPRRGKAVTAVAPPQCEEELCVEPPAKRGRGAKTKKAAAALSAPATPPAVHVAPEREVHESPRPGVVQELTEFYETYASPLPIRRDGISMVLEEITRQAEVDSSRPEGACTKQEVIAEVEVEMAEPAPTSSTPCDAAVLSPVSAPVAEPLPKKTKLAAFLSQESSPAVHAPVQVAVSTIPSPLKPVNEADTIVEPIAPADLMDIEIQIEEAQPLDTTRPLDDSMDLAGSMDIQANDSSFFSSQGETPREGVAEDKLPNMSNLHSFIPLLKKTNDRPKSPIKQEVKALKAAAMKKTEEEKKMEERERRKALIAACKNRREQGQAVSAADKEKEMAKKAEDEKEKKRKEFEEAKRLKEEEEKVKKLEKKKKQEERLAQIKAEEEKRRKEMEERRKVEEQERMKKEKEEEQRRKALKEQMERDRKKKEEEERARKEAEDKKKEEASRKKKEEEELAKKAKLALQEAEAAASVWRPPPVEESRMNHSKPSPSPHLPPSAIKAVYNSSVSACNGPVSTAPLSSSSSFKIGNAQAIPLSVDPSVPSHPKAPAVSSSPLASAKPVASTTPGAVVPPVPLFNAAPQPLPLQPSAAASKEELETYEISDKESDSEDDEEDPSKPKKKIPNWARSANVTQSLQSQLYIDPDTIFGPCPNTCNLEEIFQSKQSTYHRRGSSANWAEDRLTWREVSNYKKYMRFQPSTPGV